MAVRTTSVPERMAASAAVLLAQHGYQGTSFATVLEAADAPRGSVYHHFPEGKEQLVGAAIALASRRALEHTHGFTGLSAPEIVDAFVAIWKNVLTQSDFQAGCSIVAVTVSSDVPELVDRAGAIFREWTNELAAAFRRAGIGRTEARELAMTLISACEGATVVCRAQKSLLPLAAVSAQLGRLARLASES